MVHDHYFSNRAEQELRMADLASSPEARRAHFELAGYLLDACYNPKSHTSKDGPGKALRVVPGGSVPPTA